tara:strand:- start:192 stop:1049 length:858 start_codon:yes stop_codon:yes gene_type:complete
MDSKLQSLLYRKSMTFKLMGIWSKGIKMYSEYVDECKKVIDKDVLTDESQKFLALTLEKSIHEAEMPMKHYITSFKQAKTEYENYIIPEIEKIASKEEQMSIEFEDAQKIADELSNIEIYGSHSKQPDNVELIQVNEDIKHHIKLLKKLIEETNEQIKSTNDSYLLSKLNLDLFQHNMHLITNIKRLKEREDYYYNSFKPVYDKDMKEADKYLELMLDRARDIIKLGVDIKLGFLLQEYEKNKHDKEKVWLFYTALKSRLKKIGKEMRKNKGQFKGKMHLAKDII